jgi:hypothetical protein
MQHYSQAAAVAGEQCVESWLSSRDCLDALAKRNSQVPAGNRTRTSKPIRCYSKSLQIVAAVTYPFLRSTDSGLIRRSAEVCGCARMYIYIYICVCVCVCAVKATTCPLYPYIKKESVRTAQKEVFLR